MSAASQPRLNCDVPSHILCNYEGFLPSVVQQMLTNFDILEMYYVHFGSEVIDIEVNHRGKPAFKLPYIRSSHTESYSNCVLVILTILKWCYVAIGIHTRSLEIEWTGIAFPRRVWHTTIGPAQNVCHVVLTV